jgi:hypothetical protein
MTCPSPVPSSSLSPLPDPTCRIRSLCLCSIVISWNTSSEGQTTDPSASILLASSVSRPFYHPTTTALGQDRASISQGREGGWWILLAWGIRFIKEGRAERTSPAVRDERGQPDTTYSRTHAHIRPGCPVH